MPVASLWPLPAPIVYAPPSIAAPVLGEDDFLAELQALLPPGRAWPRDPDSTLTALLRGFARTQAEIQAVETEILVDAFPANAAQLLPEWERTLGLPDPCAGLDPSFADRQAHVRARIANTGGQSIPYLIAYALALGYAITVTEFTPFRFGQRFGRRLYGTDWAYALQINAPGLTIRHFRFGADRFGDRFATWGNDVLQCELRRVAPAHVQLIFSYT